MVCEGHPLDYRAAELTRLAWLDRRDRNDVDWRVVRCEAAPSSSPHYHLQERQRGKHCHGKVAHATFEEAREVARAMEKRTPERGQLSVYVCRVCFAYHVGHPTQSHEPRAVGVPR